MSLLKAINTRKNVQIRYGDESDDIPAHLYSSSATSSDDSLTVVYQREAKTLFSIPQVGGYGAVFAQALPRDSHSTPFYYARPQSLSLSYPERSVLAAHNASSMGTSGISSLGVYTVNGPVPSPQSLLTG